MRVLWKSSVPWLLKVHGFINIRVAPTALEVKRLWPQETLRVKEDKTAPQGEGPVSEL